MSEQGLILKASEAEKEETLVFLSELHSSPHLTQRDLSTKLNVSLGKTNYLIKQFIKTGMLKVRNFSENPGKIKKVKYILTKKGFKEKVRLTYYFLKRKESEYNRMKDEWERLASFMELIDKAAVEELKAVTSDVLSKK